MTTKINLYNLDIDQDYSWVYPITDKAIKNSMPYVQEAGNFLCNKNFYTECQGLNSFLIKYTIQGEGSLNYHSITNHIRPGELFWIDTFDWQYYNTSSNSRFWHVIWIHFYGKSVQKMYKLFLENNNNNNVISMPENNKIAVKIQKIIDIYSNSKDNNLILLKNFQSSKIIHSILYEILLSTIESFETNTIPFIIREACKFLANNYFLEISLDLLANKYNVNKFYFQKLFKQYTRTTPHSYLINCRINESKELLRTTNLSITEIGFKVGFNNVSHFISVFKKSENSTPGNYRKQWRK